MHRTLWFPDRRASRREAAGVWFFTSGRSLGMKKTIKIIGLLVLGAVLGQVLLVSVSILHVIHKIKDPGFLMQMTMLGTAPNVMSNEELGIWNKMRDHIRHEEYSDVNRLIQITNGELNFEVIPAKPVFTQGKGILAEIRFKNVSGHTLHVNEPREMRPSLEMYHYEGLNQLDCDISISPLESTWMRTLQPGEQISLPTLIVLTNTGPYKINYSLSIFEFNQQRHDELTGSARVINRATCNFDVQ
jgi:hypothetical protein